MFNIDMYLLRLYFVLECEGVHYIILILDMNISQKVGIPLNVLVIN